MKKLLLTLLVLMVFGIVGSVQAGHPPTGNNTRIISHCGCLANGSDLAIVWVDVGNGRGHNRHRTGDTEFCRDESETPNMACDRTVDDCVVAGPLTTAKGNQTALSDCGHSAATPGTDCGTACASWSD